MRGTGIWILALALSMTAGCKKQSDEKAQRTPSTGPGAPATEAPGPVQPMRAAAIAHGGVGSPPDRSDGCRAAVDAALAVIERGGEPVDAAVAGVIVMEDDERFNAGTGSRVRLDGKTVQMDASVMTSDGRFGAVAVIESVRNPVKVARAVLDTPHLVLAGEGATRFARTLGMEPYDPATENGKKATAEIIAKLRAADPSLPEAWLKFDWRSRWNFETTLEQAGLSATELGHDTVGVAVRAADGRYAVALSTGGTVIMLQGRVGDVPIHGAGLYAGAHGAVAATGSGERIVEASLSRRVHDALASGTSADQAARNAVAELDTKGDIGIIVIDAKSMAAAADRPMAWAGRELGSTQWLGPDPKAAPAP